MQKKYWKYAAFVLLVGAAGAAIKGVPWVNERQEAIDRFVVMPDLQLYRLDSTHFTQADLQPGRPTVLVFFNSTCDHCQREAREFQEHQTAFAGTNLVWISSENLADIRRFAEEYKLDNFLLTHLPPGKAATFGELSVPTIFIYDPSRRLLRRYNGETPVKSVLKYVNATH